MLLAYRTTPAHAVRLGGPGERWALGETAGTPMLEHIIQCREHGFVAKQVAV
jgi:hypothetical protein